MKKVFNGTRPNPIHLVYPFWISGKSWKSWLLIAIVLSYTFGSVYLAVWANQLTGQVIDAMMSRQWTVMRPVLATSLGVSVAGVILAIINYVASELLKLEWRSWMTDHFLSAWSKHSAFYEIERDGLVTNADQRISQDIDMFIQDTMQISFDLLNVVVTLVSFLIVLWDVSGTLTFTCFGRHVSIPGYMVYVAVLYQAIAFLITHLTGRRLIPLLSNKQTVEANFRYLGMQVRENAEQIAFYRGGERERQHLHARFGEVITNWKRIIATTGRMMFFRDTYVQTGSIVPTLAALPRYLVGAITLGDVTRIAGAFNQVSNTLSFFSQAYAQFSEWLALGHRLSNLSWAIARAEHLQRDVEVIRHPGDHLELSTITLALPTGETMAMVPQVRIRHGERWLIRGRSGVGKSTYLRAISGMWPYGAGTVKLPESASLMFLPQRSYIPYGTLKAALNYPADVHEFSHDQCCAVLKKCMLEGYTSSLDIEDKWQQRLSGGEQQRLAIARVILHRPDFVFLDEATSALDVETEKALYSVLLESLPDSSIISVAHRETLTAFHDHMLVLRCRDDQLSSPPLSQAMALNTNDDPSASRLKGSP